MKVSKVSQDGLRHMCIKCPHLETMLGPCFDHGKTMFCLSLAPYQLELWHFSRLIQCGPGNMSLERKFLDPVNAIMWPCWIEIWHSITSRWAGALKLSAEHTCRRQTLTSCHFLYNRHSHELTYIGFFMLVHVSSLIEGNLSRSTPEASNRDPMTGEYFARNIFMILAPQNQNVWKKIIWSEPSQDS